MRRLSLWMRRHPIFGDSVIALLLALFTVTESAQGFAPRYPQYYWPVAVLMVVPLVFRRRRPVLVAYLIMVGAAVQLITHGDMAGHPSQPIRISDLALAFALYTLVADTERRKAMAYAGLLLAGTAVDLTWHFSNNRTIAVVIGIGALLIYGFSWVLGEFVGARRAYHHEVESRLRLLETERDQKATIAVAAERTRIARELHDVVAHAVSVIVVQADGAGYAIHDDPDLAQSAVRTISTTGREALIELRRLLDVLRSDTDERDTRAPQPDVTALPELVEKVIVTGVPVRLDLRGELAGLPAAVGLGIYRIVQESLTNTLKHAGAGAGATVRVERVGGLVEVAVDDDGRPTPGATRDLAAVSGGNGLIGMRERASVLGGTLTAGRAPDGGWQVRAIFPVSAPDGAGTE